MKMSEKGRKDLANSEALRTHMYHDSAGLPTIGIGHLLTRSELSSGKIMINGLSVKWSLGLTHTQCYNLFDQDLARFERAVEKYVHAPLNQGQFDALVHFSYNTGVSAFAGSTLVKVINKGEYSKAPEQFRRWRIAGGEVSQGLINRREKEVRMWNGEI